MPAAGATEDETEWQPEDEVFIPFWDTHGALLGVFSIGEPASGLRLIDSELDMLVAVASLAARSVQGAQQAAAAAGSPADARAAPAGVVDAGRGLVGGGRAASRDRRIVAALRFERVAVLLPDADGLLVPRPRPAGRSTTRRSGSASTSRPRRPVFDPAFEVEGCYLMSSRTR